MLTSEKPIIIGICNSLMATKYKRWNGLYKTEDFKLCAFVELIFLQSS